MALALLDFARVQEVETGFGAKAMRFQDTVLGGLLKMVPRGQFARLVAAHGSDRGVRRLASWSQLVALLVAQLAGCRSLRELVPASCVRLSLALVGHGNRVDADRHSRASDGERRSPDVR